jgi:hypothetical protein
MVKVLSMSILKKNKKIFTYYFRNFLILIEDDVLKEWVFYLGEIFESSPHHDDDSTLYFDHSFYYDIIIIMVDH